MTSKAKFGIFLLIIALCVMLIGFVVIWPFIILWAINVLFSCAFPFTFKYWVAIVVILTTAVGLFQTKVK
jgi:hypothetical protein